MSKLALIEQSKGNESRNKKDLKKTLAVSFGVGVFGLSICQM
jgi:hypothetical protein